MAITSGKKDDKGGLSKGEMDALKALVGAGATAGSGGKVYMGKKPKVRLEGRGFYQPKGSLWLTEGEATQWYYSQDQKWQGDFVAKAIVSGMLKFGDGPMEGASLWKKLIKEAGQYGAAGKKVSPFDLMASYVQSAGGTGASAWRQQGVWEINTVTGERKYSGPGKYIGGGKSQQTDTRVDLTDPDTARSMATRLFQDMMGRDPGAGELGAFASALHEAEQASPVVSTTTTQYDMETGQALGTSTQQSGGMSAEGKAYLGEQQIKGKKEYGAFQAATTYQGALENLVFGAPE